MPNVPFLEDVKLEATMGRMGLTAALQLVVIVSRLNSESGQVASEVSPEK